MPDYSKGKVYQIVCKNTGKIYVGSTTKELHERLSAHKTRYRKCIEKKDFCYITSFEIIKEGNYEILLLEECNVSSKKELVERESHYIKTIECVNKVIPNRTDEEKMIYKKMYRQENLEHVRKLDRQSYQRNRDKILEKSRKYREEHKEEIYAKQNAKTTCECGGSYSLKHKSQHFKTNKHRDFEEITKLQDIW